MISIRPDTSDTADGVGQASWFASLGAAHQALVRATAVERSVAAGDPVARTGEASSHWIGVVRGFLHMSVTAPDGTETALHYLRDGEWGGEGSILKREPRRYDVVAVQPSRVCLVPADTFDRLHAESIAFNHFLLSNLNERMSVVTGLLEAARLQKPDVRVARCLAMLVAGHPSSRLTLAQHQLANLCGLSRQRTNSALRNLKLKGLLRLEGQCIHITSAQSMSAYSG